MTLEDPLERLYIVAENIQYNNKILIDKYD